MADLTLAMARHRGVVADTLAMSDGIAGLFPFKAIVADSVGSTDGIAGLFVLKGSISDDVSQFLIDQVTSTLQAGILVLSYTMADTLGVDDNVTSVQRLLGLVADSVGPADQVSALYRYLASMGEDQAASLVDLVASSLVEVGVALPLTYGFGDSVGVTDGISGLQKFLGSVAESVSMTDQATATLRFLASVADTVAASDGIVAIQRMRAEVSDVLGLTDAIAARFPYLASMADSTLEVDIVTATLVDSSGDRRALISWVEFEVPGGAAYQSRIPIRMGLGV
jgi:hypothetical protein